MRLYAVHVKPDAEPVLMSEGFAWASFFLGPLWLASQRAWIPAAFSLSAYVVVLLWLPAAWGVAAACRIALLLGLKSAEYPAVLQLLQSAEHTDQIRRWPWGRIVVSLLFLLTVAAHLVVQILLCQPLSCSDLLWLRMSAFQG